MTAAGTGICDGCDREGPVQQLEEVILPSGAIVVCPECRYHAEELAERATAECDGCGNAVTAATLDRTELPDGTELLLCPDCRATVSAGANPDREVGGSSTAGDAATGSTSETVGTGSDEERAATGREATTTGDAATADGEAGATASTAGADEAATSTADGSRSASAGNEAVTDGATDRPATTRNTCDQCGGRFSIELYRVTTVDGRTEQFCPDCKDDGVEQGIVNSVELRRAQAYEVLGLAGSASSEDVREAYLDQVKEVHPDRADGSRSEFKLVQQAYERLRED